MSRHTPRGVYSNQCCFHAYLAARLVSSAGLAESYGLAHRRKILQRLGSPPSSARGSGLSCRDFVGFPRHFLEVGLRMPQASGGTAWSASKREAVLRKKSVGPGIRTCITMRIKDLRISRGLGILRHHANSSSTSAHCFHGGGQRLSLWVSLDKSEGVVKRHLYFAMLFCTAPTSELVQSQNSGHLPVNHFSVESFHQLSIRPNPRP